MPARKPKPPPIQITPDELSLWRRLVATTRDVLERYAHLAEIASAIFERVLSKERSSKKAQDEILERIERIERLLLLERTGHSASAEAREIRSEVRQELSSLEWQLSRQVQNLNYLQEQAAGYGSRIPLWLVNELADQQELVQSLQNQLRQVSE